MTNVPGEPQKLPAEELKPGQFVAAGSYLSQLPTEVLFTDTYPTDRGRTTLIVHRPLGKLDSTPSTCGGNRWFYLATEAELAALREQAERAQKLADLRQVIDFLAERPWLPLPDVHVHAHFHDLDGYRLVRELAEREGVDLDTKLDDRTKIDIHIGALYYSAIAWHPDGRPAEPAPQPLTLAPIAKHYDASAFGEEFVCACGSAFGDSDALKWHVDTANASDPTGLAYTRADDEPDDPAPVSGTRVEPHVGGVTEAGLVDETESITGAAITADCVITGWRGVCTTHQARHIASGEAECGCPVYPFMGRGDTADTIVDHRVGCPEARS